MVIFPLVTSWMWFEATIGRDDRLREVMVQVVDCGFAAAKSHARANPRGTSGALSPGDPRRASAIPITLGYQVHGER